MINKLRIKFIAITMGVLVIVFVVVFLTLNIYMQESSATSTEQLLEAVAQQDGFEFPIDNYHYQPDKLSPEPPMPERDVMSAGRFFYVKVNKDGVAFDTNFEMMFNFTEQEAVAFANEALKSERESGTIDNLQFIVVEKEYGKIVVFAERSIETRMLERLINVSVWVAGGTFLVLFVFSLFLSNWAVKPVAVAFMKQRRFISDASHELKTPLTIINANADALEGEVGINKKIVYIIEQSARMNLLINDLLKLAKADENSADIVMHEFDISKTIHNIALGFESAAFEAEKNYSCDIEENLHCVGNKQQIQQLASILIDNAIKHSSDNGEIEISLKKIGSKLQLSVYNTGQGVPDDERERIFDRFYRSDDSRTRETGGYGLGLSIAQSIVAEHNGKVVVEGETGKWVNFIIIL